MVFYVENENCLKVRITKPQSRKNLRQLATQIRAKLGIDSKQLYVDILFCLEILISKIDSSFQYKIFDPGDFEKPNEAFFSPENNCIFIRSDVYNKARDEDGRARFTIAHEIAHYFLFKILGIPYYEDWENIMYYSDAKLHSVDPEWQADVVGNYLLCEPDCIKDFSEEDIVFYCGVTNSAAYTALQNAKGHKYVDYSAIFMNKSFSDVIKEYSQ